MFLKYNRENGRFGVMKKKGWDCDGLHCGQTFQVKIKGRWVNTRIGKASDWYLVDLNLAGAQLEHLLFRWNDEV